MSPHDVVYRGTLCVPISLFNTHLILHLWEQSPSTNFDLQPRPANASALISNMTTQIHGRHIFALRPWQSNISKLMCNPIVQACTFPTGRVLYFALPTNGAVLDILVAKELSALYHHLENTLGLIQTIDPCLIDHLAVLMDSILSRICLRHRSPLLRPSNMLDEIAGVFESDPDRHAGPNITA